MATALRSTRPSGGEASPVTPPCSLSDRDAHAWFGLLRAHGALVRAVDAELMTAHRLSMSSHEVLYRVARSPEGHLSVSELADQLPISASRVSRLVDELAAMSLVERRSCPSDARVSHVSITDSGRDSLGAFDDTFHDAVRRHFTEQLSARELDALASAWRKLGVAGGC